MFRERNNRLAFVFFFGLSFVFQADAFVLYHISDPHCGHVPGHPMVQQVIAKINAAVDADIVVVSGDLVEIGQDVHYEHFNDLIKLERGRTLFVPGNHETAWSGTSGKCLFEQKVGKRFSYLDIENWRVIGLDVSIHKQHYAYIDGCQLEWLRDTLRQAGDKNCIVVLHHPVFRGDGAMRNQRELYEVLKDHKVKLVLCGHRHRGGMWKYEGMAISMAACCYRGNYTRFEIEGDSVSVSYHNCQGKETPYGDLQLFDKKGRLDARKKLEQPLTGPFPAVEAAGIIKGDADLKLLIKTKGQLYAPPVYDGGNIYFGDSCGNAYGLRLADGTTVMSRSLAAGIVSSPIIFKGEPVYCTEQGDVYLPGRDVALDVCVSSGPKRAGEKLVVTTHDGRLIVLDMQGKTEPRVLNTGTALPVAGMAVKDDSRIFFACRDGSVRCVTVNGLQIWKTQLQQSIYQACAPADPLLTKGLVILTGKDGKVHALKQSDGTQVWEAELPHADYFSPLAYKDLVIVGNYDGKLSALSRKDGKEIWSLEVGSAIHAGAVQGDSLYLAGAWSRVFKLDLVQREISHEIYIPSGPLWSSPLVRDGVVYQATFGGELYAITCR